MHGKERALIFSMMICHGPIMKETAFESLPLHTVLVPIPIAPETEVVLVPGGLNTDTGTVPGFAISAAVIAALNW